MDDKMFDNTMPSVSFYTDGKGRWMKKVWATQCPVTLFFNDRCQGVYGHEGDHWCFKAEGSYCYKPHTSDPQSRTVGCGLISPDDAAYRTPLERSRYCYLHFNEYWEVTDAEELARLERGEFKVEEGVDRPCTEEEFEELRKLGRLAPDEQRLRHERTAELKFGSEDFSAKSTNKDIEERFDGDVERFSNLDTGQSATIDAPLAMQLITEAAVRLTPTIGRVLDIGCGAGNNTLKLHQVYGKPFVCDLLDLSAPMLERAKERVNEVGMSDVNLWHADLRTADLPKECYDVVIAAAVLHHLRDDKDWRAAFEKVIAVLRPGGSFWITDLVVQETKPIQELMWSRYGNYLEGIGGADYREKVFEYIDREDSPRSVTYQLELLRKVGFAHVELLHKNSCFSAFGAWKE